MFLPLKSVYRDVFFEIRKHKKHVLQTTMSTALLYAGSGCQPRTYTQWSIVLRFYGPVNPMGSCRARSVYLTTRLLGRLSPLSG